MFTMARALLALISLSTFLLLPTVLTAPLQSSTTQQDQTNEMGASISLNDLFNGTYEIEVTPLELDENDELRVKAERVITDPISKVSTISCNVLSAADHKFIKTYWFKQVSLRMTSHEWRRQHKSSFSGNTMTMQVSPKKRTVYKCKACLTRELATHYKRSFAGGDRCHETVIEVGAGLQ